MVAEQGIKSINLYDIFANIIPGLVFLMGLFPLFKPQPFLELVLWEGIDIPVGIPLLLFVITVAFVLGQLLQIGGSKDANDHGFAELMDAIRRGEDSNRYEISDFDDKFWDMCRTEFQLTGEFSSYGRLFKAILSFLEHSDRSRALRLQALYLFVRGVYVASVILALLYATAIIVIEYSLLPSVVLDVVRSPDILLGSSIVAAGLAYVTDSNKDDLEEDWIQYTITDCYLEMISDE